MTDGGTPAGTTSGRLEEAVQPGTGCAGKSAQQDRHRGWGAKDSSEAWGEPAKKSL